jgi:hypothetical protein
MKTQEGIPMIGNLVTLTAAIATASAVYQISNSASMRGTKTFKVKKLLIHDVASGDTVVHFGTGLGGTFVEAFALHTISNTDLAVGPESFPNVEFAEDMTAYSDALTVSVRAEVEEIG